MNPTAAILNAARHYCIRRHGEWCVVYGELQRQHRDRESTFDGWTYSREAYNTFSRYNVLGAILNEIEAFTDGDFQSLEEAKQMFVAAGESSTSPFTKAHNTVEAQAQQEERIAFVQYMGSLTLAVATQLPELPFRRVLLSVERRERMVAFENIWGSWYGGYARPITPSPRITLHTQAMEVPGAYECLRELIARRGAPRLFELREWGPSFELEAANASYFYNGAEGFWFSAGLAWMVYASHESSITFGGDWLIEAMRERLPDFHRYVYKSWAVEDYPPL